MTLRDLTKRQLYNLRRRCARVYREKQLERQTPDKKTFFEVGFSEGVKAALELK